MIRFTLPNVRFDGVALLSTGAVLTIDTQPNRAPFEVCRLWVPGDEVNSPRTVPWSLPARYLPWPNAERYLRTQGMWPSGEDLPTLFPDSAPRPPALEPQREWVPFAFHPDGATAAFCVFALHSDFDYHLRRADGSLVRLPTPTRGTYHHAAFSPAGTRLAMSFDNMADVWGVSPPAYIGRYVGTGQQGTGPAFLDESRLAMAVARTVCVWDTMQSGSSPQKLSAFPKFADALAVSPDGRRMLAGDRTGEVRMYDGASLEEIGRFDWKVGAVTALAFASDGLTAAVAGQFGVAVWDVE